MGDDAGDLHSGDLDSGDLHSEDLRRNRLVLITGWVVVAAGVAAVVLRTVNGAPGAETDPRALFASVALGGAIAAPGVMALLARYDRPVLMLPAAVILVPAAFLSFAGVLLPLLVPAFLLFRTYARHRRSEGWLDAIVAVALLALWFTAIVVLLGDTGTVEYRSGTSTHTTELSTYLASVGSLVLWAAGLGLAWWATAPRPSAAVEPAARARHSTR